MPPAPPRVELNLPRGRRDEMCPTRSPSVHLTQRQKFVGMTDSAQLRLKEDRLTRRDGPRRRLAQSSDHSD